MFKINLTFSLASVFRRNTARSAKRFMSLNSTVHKRKIPYTNSLIACATALGLSYIVHKNTIFCEVDLTSESTESDAISNERNYEEAVKKSRDILQRIKDERGIPGLVVGVSVDGKTVWEEGLGYADVENRVLCSPDTVMRIASISKSITMAAVARLWEHGLLDLDKPVQEYVPYFPQKMFDGKQVTITCRQLVSHLGGIRHYNPDGNDSKKSDKNIKDNGKKTSEMDLKEYYYNVYYDDIKSSLGLFKDDPLVEKPGAKYVYSTYAWTLVSAIVEEVSKEKFTIHITKLFKTLGMKHTYLDENDVLIYHRSRNYRKNKQGKLINSPYVDNSYKWAGGGFLSTVGDLMQFGNAMLYSEQFKSSNDHRASQVNKNATRNDGKLLEKKDVNQNIQSVNAHQFSDQKRMLPGFLNSKTVKVMWTPVAPKYGMGWQVCPEKQECEFCDKTNFLVYHTGGAVGASSVLLISPKVSDAEEYSAKPTSLPKGTIVVILSNMHDVGLAQTAAKIASLFENL